MDEKKKKKKGDEYEDGYLRIEEEEGLEVFGFYCGGCNFENEKENGNGNDKEKEKENGRENCSLLVKKEEVVDFYETSVSEIEGDVIFPSCVLYEMSEKKALKEAVVLKHKRFSLPLVLLVEDPLQFCRKLTGFCN